MSMCAHYHILQYNHGCMGPQLPPHTPFPCTPRTRTCTRSGACTRTHSTPTPTLAPTHTAHPAHQRPLPPRTRQQGRRHGGAAGVALVPQPRMQLHWAATTTAATTAATRAATPQHLQGHAAGGQLPHGHGSIGWWLGPPHVPAPVPKRIVHRTQHQGALHQSDQHGPGGVGGYRVRGPVPRQLPRCAHKGLSQDLWTVCGG
jgi:hypothetical protein